jgi:hypothetical protein
MNWKDSVNKKIEKLTQEQEKWQDHQALLEEKMSKIIGRKVSPAEFANLRQLFFDWERCETKCENLGDRISEWEQSA